MRRSNLIAAFKREDGRCESLCGYGEAVSEL